MVQVTLPDNHSGKEALTLDELLTSLQKIKDEHNCGKVKIYIAMEPLLNNQEHQLLESLCEVSAAVTYVKEKYSGVESIHLLGRSFS